MRYGLLAAAAVLVSAGAADAQAPFTYKPIDTQKLLIQPTDTASGVAAGTSTSLFRTVTRTLADTVENNGFVRTVNNLLGRRAQPAKVQEGFSPLPLAGSFKSVGYTNMYRPAMPTATTFGQTPNVVTPVGPTGR